MCPAYTATSALTATPLADSSIKDRLVKVVNFILFTGEKLFTVAAPTNSQNDRFYVRPGTLMKDVNENMQAPSNKTDIQQVGDDVGRRLDTWLH